MATNQKFDAVEVAGPKGPQVLEAKHVILATGSAPRSLPGVTIDEDRVISSNGAVRNERAPRSLVIIGAGAVGVEFADVYAAYGVQVTLLEALPRILPVEDEEVSAQMAKTFSRRGIGVRTGVKVSGVKVADKATGEILGVHIIGPEATEIIHEFAVGRTLEATLEEIVHTIHAHPTLSEAALEATLSALGHAIHI